MRKIKILIADDHAAVRSGTRESLQTAPDIEVVGEAVDGEEAVILAGELQPDIIMMDIQMPNLNGIEATIKVKEKYPEIAVLILTAFDNDQYLYALLNAGAAGYLLKSMRAQELIEAIRAVYAGESALHPAIARRVIQRLAEPDPHGQPEMLLSQMELEILKMAASGVNNRNIAEKIRVSPRELHMHLENIFSKLNVASRTEAVLSGLKKGLVSQQDFE